MRPSSKSRQGSVDPTEDTLLEELELMQRAREAQRRGQLERALDVLDDHLRRFPSSKLDEERMATRVVVLCGLGRVDQAHRAHAALARRHPRSSYIGTALNTCDERR